MKKKTIVRIAILIAIAVVAELFVFNFRYFESLFFATGREYAMEITGAEKIDDHRYSVTDSENLFITFPDLREPVYNVYLDLAPSDPVAHRKEINLTFFVTDAGNSNELRLSNTEAVTYYEESKYIRLHLFGESEYIRVQIRDFTDDVLIVNRTGINVVRPLMIRPWRMMLVLLVAGFITLFRPGSALYATQLDWKTRWQKGLMLFVLLVCLAATGVIWATFYNRDWQHDSWRANLQYNDLATALLEGHTDLNIPVPESIRKMENPYDFVARWNALAAAGEGEIMDLAYYNGRYYSYFGVVPVLLFYIPFLVITGHQLSTGILIFVLTCAFIVCSFWLLYVLVKKKFSECSIGAYLLLSMVFVSACEISYFLQMATLYSLPILCAMLFDLLGLTFWLLAVGKDGIIRKRYLILGAVSVALVIGCRPQMAIAMLLAFPLFWKEIREGLFFSRKGLANTICVILPIALIGIGILWYNYLRFGRFLEFGANYNMTGFDMTHRGMDPERFLTGFFEYYFRPLTVIDRFPYLQVAFSHMGLVTDYQGQMISEPFTGGYFALNIIGVFLFSLRRVKETLKEKQLYGFVLFSLLFAVIITGVDIQIVGITQRYLSDFSVFLTIPLMIVLLSLLNGKGGKRGGMVFRWIVCLSLCCIVINLFAIMARGRYNDLFNVKRGAFNLMKYQLFPFLSIR